ncbi:MAG: S-layer family protein [Coleofasciculus sp. B1-GNL1-01]|uniref:two-partner secretion domain-containing protein n=1 Tax=Coleofasciculus sp. B1-GNL1-01 TaxID=3068484 RepID=UPI0032FA49DD
MAQKTHPLLVQASESEEAGEVESRGIREMLGRLSRKSCSKLAGYTRVGSVALTSCVWLAWGSSTVAQIIPDEAWGDEQSVRTPNAPLLDGTLADFLIEAGATRGANRFHSFEQFDIGEGQSVYFDSPQGIENIFSRVRGNDASDILGTLGVNGGANLFLINPNGIIFGESAKLDVNGSFVATTANGIQFGEQGFFSTTQLEAPSPLLTVNPSAFLFNQITLGRIESRSVAFAGFTPLFPLLGLKVPDGQSLLLVGGDILIDGQFNFGGLAAIEGRLELAAVAGSGTVGLTVDGDSLSLNFPSEIPRGDIALTNGAFVTTAGEGGGDIQVWGKEITLTNFSRLFSGSFGTGKGGNIVVNASERVQASGLESGFFANNYATGDGGDVIVTTPVLQLRDGSQIVTATFAQGNAGNIVVNASESVKVSGSVTVDGTPISSGLRTDARLDEGNGGDITINTPVLEMKDGAVIASSSSRDSTGDGGDIKVFASESVQLMGESRLTSQTAGEGDAGNLRIDTPLLMVQNQAEITADTIRRGKAGIIEINAAQVQLDGGGIIASGTFGEGDAGDILLQVEDSLTISGDGSGVLAETGENSSGNGGSIMIDSRTVVVRDRGQITVESEGIGTGGNISLEADSLILDTNAGLLADTDANTGGNIVLTLDDLLLLRRDSRISTNAGKDEERGNGGNIIIEAVFIVAVPNENSDITANAFEGQGGNVTITTQGLFNLVIRSREELEALLGTKEPSELDPMNLQSNDVTAISQTSPELSRIPILILLELDPSQGLVELPAELVDVTRLVEQNLCAAAQGSEFIVTGRGGLPTPPNQILNADAAWEDWRISTVEESTEMQQSNRNSRQDVTGNKPNKFVEAQGWFKDANGTIILTTEPTVVTPHATGSPSFPCQ